MNGGEGAEEFLVLDLDYGDGFFGCFLRHGAAGHDRNAGVNFHCAFDGFDVVKFHHVIHFNIAVA